MVATTCVCNFASQSASHSATAPSSRLRFAVFTSTSYFLILLGSYYGLRRRWRCQQEAATGNVSDVRQHSSAIPAAALPAIASAAASGPTPQQAANLSRNLPGCGLPDSTRAVPPSRSVLKAESRSDDAAAMPPLPAASLPDVSCPKPYSVTAGVAPMPSEARCSAVCGSGEVGLALGESRCRPRREPSGSAARSCDLNTALYRASHNSTQY
jgi:hypothetical protein